MQFRSMEPKRCGTLRLALLKLATERIRSGPTAEAKKPEAPIQAAAPDPAQPPGRKSDLYNKVPAADLMAASSSKVTSVASAAKKMSMGTSQVNYWQDPFQGKKIGEVLVRMGKLTQEQVDNAVEDSRKWRERFGEFVVKRGLVTPAELCRALALATGMPTTDLKDATIRRTYREIFPAEIMRRYEFIPFDANEKVVCIAAGSPLDDTVLAEIRSLTKKRVEVFLAEEQLVLQLLNKSLEEAIQEANLAKNRRFPRFNMPLPVSYYFCTSNGERLEDISYTGQTINISEGGFRVEGPHTDFGMMGNLQQYGLYVQLSASFPPHEFSALCKPVYLYEKENHRNGRIPVGNGPLRHGHPTQRQKTTPQRHRNRQEIDQAIHGLKILTMGRFYKYLFDSPRARNALLSF